MDLFSAALVFAALAYASVVDMKTREVPDWLSYGLFVAALGVAAIRSALASDWLILAGSFGGLCAGFGFGWAMYSMGQWGGGDAKLMAGIGAAIGIPLVPFSPYITFLPLPQLLSYIMNLVLLGAAYGIVWSVFLALKHRKTVGERLAHYSKISRRWRFPLQFGIVIATIAAIIFLEPELRFWVQLLLLIIFSSAYLWVFIKAVEDGAMKKWMHPTKLTEGDWIAEPVRVGKKTIASPKDLGVNKEQIKELISLSRKKKVTKVLVKEGIPFVPSLLISYVATIAFGNLFLFLIP